MDVELRAQSLRGQRSFRSMSRISDLTRRASPAKRAANPVLQAYGGQRLVDRRKTVAQSFAIRGAAPG